MTADQLRKSILQRAIQGKLISQDPNDEHASVLLERIREEKNRLIKEKKIKKNKNESLIFKSDDNRHYEKLADGTVKCIEEEIPYEVPENWAWCRLESLMQKVSSGSTPRGGRNVYVENGVKFIRSQNVYNEGLVISTIAYITSEIHKEKSNSHVKANDLLLNITGASIGRCALVPGDFDIANINQHVLILRLIDYSIKEFIHLAITSPLVFNQIMDMQVGGTKEGLSAEKANKLFIPIPPLNEQSKIIDKIHTLIPQINIYSNLENDGKRLDEELPNQLKKSILQYAIQGKLVSQDANDEPASLLLKKIEEEKKCLTKEGKIKRNKTDSFIFKGDDNKYYERINGSTFCINAEIPFEIPDSWIWSRGSQCFKPMESTKPEGESFEYIDIDAVNNKLNTIEQPKVIEVVKAPSRASRKICKGDTLFSMVRPYLKNIVYVPEQYEHCIASTGFFVFKPTKLFYPKFLYWLLLSPYVIDGLNQFMKGDNSPSINGDNVEQFLYPIPPVEEQIRIVKHLQNILNIIKD